MITVSHCSYNRYEPDESEFSREFPKGRSCYVFYFILTPAKIVINSNSYHTKPNTLLITTPDTPYFIYAGDYGYLGSYFRFQCIPKDISEFNIPLNKPLSIANTSSLQNYLLQICTRTHFSSDTIEQLEVHSLCTLLFCELHTQLFSIPKHTEEASLASSVSSDKYQLLNQIRIEVLSNLFEHWTVEQLAKMAHMSTKQFRHYYRKFFHFSPKEDLQLQRLNLAKMYLLTRNHSISEVAYFCGFQSLYSFTGFFTKKEGCSPSQYRKLHASVSTDSSFHSAINC
jgi:AraC-like DNA-binding protein